MGLSADSYSTKALWWTTSGEPALARPALSGTAERMWRSSAAVLLAFRRAASGRGRHLHRFLRHAMRGLAPRAQWRTGHSGAEIRPGDLWQSSDLRAVRR